MFTFNMFALVCHRPYKLYIVQLIFVMNFEKLAITLNKILLGYRSLRSLMIKPLAL